MNKVTIWQCTDYCCENRPFNKRYWFARSASFEFYEMVSEWDVAWKLTNDYLRGDHP